MISDRTEMLTTKINVFFNYNQNDDYDDDDDEDNIT